MDKKNKINKIKNLLKMRELKRYKVILEFRENPTFYKYCILTSDFHYQHREMPYIKEICDTMEEFIDNELLNNKGNPYLGLVITLPPGHGKTRTAQLLDSYIFFQKNKRAKIANFSYAMDNAKNSCMSVKNDINKNIADEPYLFTPKELFGFELEFKKDLNTKTEWSLATQPLISYWTGAPKSQITGKRANILKYDDIVKNSKESLNAEYMDFLYETFFLMDTLSRLENRTENTKDKVLILQTQWAKNDLIGILSSKEYEDSYKVIKYPALLNFNGVYKNGEEPRMLNELKYDFATFDAERIVAEKNTISKSLFYCLTQQKIIGIQDALYNFGKQNFYNKVPNNNNNYKIVASFDPAKGGKDLNAVWVAIIIIDPITRKRKFYILDAYSKSGDSKQINLEIAEMLKKHNVSEVLIETNSGGDKDVIILKDSLKAIDYKCNIKPFHQKSNKERRIFTVALFIQADVLFPYGFNKTKEFKDLEEFKTTFKLNKSDDIADSLTMMYEFYGNIRRKTNNNLSNETIQILNRI